MASLMRLSALRSATMARGFRTAAVLRDGPFSSGGGHVSDTGGKFKEREQAMEEAYFRKQTAEQLKALREYMEQKKKSSEMLIAEHEEEIRKHKEAILDLHDDMEQVSKVHDDKK
ncbi:ATPase inhibitor, mitochondrial-like [Sycon ciliatum]|uniref:ATPase inhibitor, mitochondrial-like n=1 Tax=Sycon ciliatum TaxID=27933 RepID=UPI0020AAFE93|eukprot:scpid49354/ scgid21711/ ATPase inhibitor, mitochondrial; Inhibitor of F(1)F(o)-ATPase